MKILIRSYETIKGNYVKNKKNIIKAGGPGNNSARKYQW